ncbi:predicted protein [Postia placenta Mad-698-R]|uniref:Uncharacterized protein n=2 Tax=Rhodonia placenta TaxID=104341 RepID=A0A1X6NGA5_9APHY|nr:hypothetical protein POSPLADRAFT_1042759 [Postia placenta MAD-698-R-SB12]EED83957.1 predicted protein [Postia placenta Mad-698-R]KAF9822157.1 hypothetical protein IEO21_00151 [Postia placenta]OSX67550.1 hypothetical protein POSPLADRAFT_1042759 [Postia placenta MAD-698-R-SB12]
MDSIAYQETLDDLRESILPMWPQGVAAEESKRDYWRVRFGGSPWTCVGADAILCGVCIICFSMTLTDMRIQSTETRVSLVRGLGTTGILVPNHGPNGMRKQLAQTLRPLFPRKVQSFGANEDGVHIIEVKRDGLRSREMSKNIFHACMLREFNHLGYKLDGSVQLGKKGPLGFGSRREAWIFRSIIRRQEVRLKE